MLPKKLLGQNFLIDEKIASRIVEAVDIRKGDIVVEVGPGRGILTEKILNLPCKLFAVELDRGLYSSLQRRLGDRKKLKLVRGDFLRFDLRLAAKEGKLKLVGNLPYRITGPVMRKIVGDREVIEAAVFMVQKEVADRLSASSGTKAYGLLSIFVQVYARLEKLFQVSPRCFKPQPKVSSTVVRITTRPIPLVKPEEEEFFFWLVKTAFSQRRKMLVNSLSGSLKISKGELEEKFREIGLEKHCRPENVKIDEFLLLASALNRERSR
jgi:16S rRNA (adenine1518-N6/adenine1519-N6)-dimethyltransferase